MEENKEKINYKYVFEDVFQTTLDFDSLSSWMNPQTNLPVCSFLSFYEASGLTEKIRDYSVSHENAQFTPLDNILCSFYTLQRIRNFLSNQWCTYSLDIDRDNHVFWDTKKFPAGTKHNARHLKKKDQDNLSLDFAHYCCGTDDDLEDNVIVFRVFSKVEVPADERAVNDPGETQNAN